MPTSADDEDPLRHLDEIRRVPGGPRVRLGQTRCRRDRRRAPRRHHDRLTRRHALLLFALVEILIGAYAAVSIPLFQDVLLGIQGVLRSHHTASLTASHGVRVWVLVGG